MSFNLSTSLILSSNVGSSRVIQVFFILFSSKSCGKCKVKLLTGEVNQEVSSHLTDEDKANGYILACCTTIIGDIEVLTNSSLDMAMRRYFLIDFPC